MKYTSEILRPGFVFLILFSVFLFSQSCYYYRAVSTSETPAEVIKQHTTTSDIMILHLGESVWEFSGITISAGSMKGSISKLQGHEYYKTTRPNRAHRYKKSRVSSKDQSDVLNEIHITISEYVEIKPDEILIFTEWIEDVEVINPAKGATIATWVLGGVGIAATAFVGFVLISLQISGYLF